MEAAAGGLLLDLLLLLQQLKHEIKISKQAYLYVYMYSLNIINLQKLLYSPSALTPGGKKFKLIIIINKGSDF